MPRFPLPAPGLFLLPLLTLLLLVPAAAKESPIILSVAVDFLPAEHFARLSEAFTGHEDTGSHSIVRSHPETRAGLYFILEIAPGLAHLPAGSQARLSWVTAAAPEPRENTFLLPPSPARGRDLYLGLTGPDWPAGPGAPHPVAWKIALLDPSGATLAEHRSFLWGTR